MKDSGRSQNTETMHNNDRIGSRYLPRRIWVKLEGRPTLQRILTNTGWLFADKFIRLGIGFFVWTWLARYLGPAQFGLLNYAVAFVALFAVIAPMGLNGIVVRDLVKYPDKAHDTLGTAFLIQLAGGLVAFAMAVLLIGVVRPDDTYLKFMVALLGLAVVFKSTEVVKYWFESQVQSKYVVWVENGVFLLSALIKVGLILEGAALLTFVWLMLAEGLIVALGFMAMYTYRAGEINRWRARYAVAKAMLADSWPLILSGLAAIVYMRIDQIMIGQMLDDEAVGVYSSAVRISEVWYFIPAAVASSVFPAIIEAKKNNTGDYYHRHLQRLYDAMVLTAVAVALPVTLWSHWIVPYLFGAAYADAAPVLAIHVWSAIFVFLGVASSNWFLLENLQKKAFYRTAVGAVANVLANLILIPRMGITGAALGTLIAQMSAAYLFDAIGKDTRPSFWLKTASLLPFIPGIRAKGF